MDLHIDLALLYLFQLGLVHLHAFVYFVESDEHLLTAVLEPVALQRKALQSRRLSLWLLGQVLRERSCLGTQASDSMEAELRFVLSVAHTLAKV